MSQRVTPAGLALILSTAVHLGVLLLVLASPRFFPQPVKLPEVYQVELYSPPAAPPSPQPPAQPAAPPPETAALQLPPVAPKATTRPGKSAQPKPAQGNRKAVSLSPIKERLEREKREREEKERQEQQNANRLAEIKLDLNSQLAREQAREAARQASRAIAESYRASTRNHPTETPAATGNPPGTAPLQISTGQFTDKQRGDALSAYKARLESHIGRHWKLPVVQDWNDELIAIVVIRIRRDGAVTTVKFDQSSGNPRFDQYVRKAVDRASPLPPLPREIEQQSEEIVVTFTPRGLK